MAKIKREDLVVLQYSPNNCYVEVVKLDKVTRKEFEINLERLVWSFGERFKDKEIGESRSVLDFPHGVIGVYNRRDIKQINAMVHAVTEIIRESSRSAIYED